MSSGSGSFRLPGSRGDQIIIFHGGSAVIRFIPESNCICTLNQRVMTDYLNKMNSKNFKKRFEEQFLPHLAPEHRQYKYLLSWGGYVSADVMAWLTRRGIPYRALLRMWSCYSLLK
jgi:hypothetical protein